MRRIEVIFILLLAFPLMAQQKAGLSSLEIGSRASSLQDCYIGIANDFQTTLWNPAGLGYLKQLQFGTSYAKLPFDQQTGLIAIIIPLSQTSKIGLNWSGFFVKDLEARSGNTELPDYLFEISEQAVWLSYALSIRKFNIGSNLKYLFYEIDNIPAQGYGIDVGMTFQATDKLRLGFAAYDIYSEVKWLDIIKERFRRTLRIGASYQIIPEFVAGIGIRCDSLTYQGAQLSAGVEYNHEYFSIRLGVSQKHFTVGFGVKYPTKKIAYNCNGGIATNKIDSKITSQFDLGMIFQGNNQKQEVKLTDTENWLEDTTDNNDNWEEIIKSEVKAEPEPQAATDLQFTEYDT
jgi:hypothetical protein